MSSSTPDLTHPEQPPHENSTTTPTAINDTASGHAETDVINQIEPANDNGPTIETSEPPQAGNDSEPEPGASADLTAAEPANDNPPPPDTLTGTE